MRPVDERVSELLERIRAGEIPRGTKKPNELNENKVEEFIRSLADHPNGTRVKVIRQELPWLARRTTRMNYVFEVPGRRPDALLLVAHYDTWGGPGADDNTTGEEILKQYLLADLEGSRPPEFTRIYFLAGSEECGLIGLMSQLLLAAFFWAVSIALTTRHYLAAAIAIVLGPLLTYRFGVSGSRHYVRTLPKADLERLRAVVSVDSVGEGKLYFPVTTLGANFLRAVLPFKGSDRLDDLLREIAHGHGICYNTYLAGGTTDHLSFLEVNRSLPRVIADFFRRIGCALSGRKFEPPFTVPASAIVAMKPGKASAFIVGGKIHTKNDTADRVYPEPLKETLVILDDFFERFETGKRPGAPRTIDDCHYARLYELSDGRVVAALKDAVEPNRRNVNILCAGRFDEASQTLEVDDVFEWGNEERLNREVAEYAAPKGLTWRRRPVARLVVKRGKTTVAFERQSGGAFRRCVSGGVGIFENLLGTYSFGAMFLSAWLIGTLANALLEKAAESRTLAPLIGDHIVAVSVGMMLLQLAVLGRLFVREFPMWIDNAYKNLNRADNLGSLRRRSPEPEVSKVLPTETAGAPAP